MMQKLCSVYFLMYLLVSVSSQILEPTLKIDDGEIRGKTETVLGLDISTFRGIPYAKPPKGALRLKNPVKPDKWSSTLDATKFGSICPQLDQQGRSIGEEDCLFINVYTPFSPKSRATTVTYPVMVFIHGDNFQRGSANIYGPERFADKVVLVTFNYRIGVLGFLSTGDDACPGNLGMEDQVMALEWVRENIQTFGGNTSSITLFGQGAGAASVILHTLSPMSKGLFHHVITQSGSPFCDWSLETEPYSYAKKVGKRLGCSVKSKRTIVDCIRDKEVSKVLEAQKDISVFGVYPLGAVPVVERNKFLPDNLTELLSKGDFRQVSLLAGVNKDDGAIFYPLILSYQEDLRKNSSFLLAQLIPKFLTTATDIRKNIESVSQAVYFHYFNGIDSTNITQVLQSFINMTSDAMFVSCNYKTLKSYLEKGADIYMYAFEYKGQNTMLDVELGGKTEYDGVSHGDELFYLFDLKNYPLTMQVDAEMGRTLPIIWTTFARTGKPPPNTIKKWEPYTAEFKYYYSFEKAQTLQTAFRQKEVELWLDHLPKLSEIRPNEDVTYRTGGFGWSMFAIALILLIVAVVLSVLLVRKSRSQSFGSKSDKAVPL